MMRFFLFMTLLIGAEAFAQEGQDADRLVTAFVTISPSIMLGTPDKYFYLHGNLDIYLSPRVSISADGYYNVGRLFETSTFDIHHSGFWGPVFHRTAGRTEMFFGIQPGLSVTRISPTDRLQDESTAINPLISTLSGGKFFMNDYMHLFISSRITLGRHFHNVYKDLADIRISAGLGFNLRR